MNKCNICQKELSYKDGEAALMMAFVINNTTNLINIGVCKNCYKTFLDGPMRMLNEKRVHRQDDALLVARR